MKRGIVLFLAVFLLLGSMFVVSAKGAPICEGLGGICQTTYTCVIGYQSVGMQDCGTGSRSDNCCVPKPDNIIMKLSSPANAHGEIWSGINYNTTFILYSDIFAKEYAGSNPHSCTSTNHIVALSATTNAHAESAVGDGAGIPPPLGYYDIDVCYGDLVCELKSAGTACDTGDVCVVELSSTLNAHLAKCGVAEAYDRKICCTSPSAGVGPVTDCTTLTTNTSCLSTPTCTWTPPKKTRGSSPYQAGCCPTGQEWDAEDQACRTTGSLCTIPWIRGATQVAFDAVHGPFKKVVNDYFYCAQISSGINTGYWYPINQF